MTIIPENDYWPETVAGRTTRHALNAAETALGIKTPYGGIRRLPDDVRRRHEARSTRSVEYDRTVCGSKPPLLVEMMQGNLTPEAKARLWERTFGPGWPD